MREGGRIGRPGTLRAGTYPSQHEAEKAQQRSVSRKLRRGDIPVNSSRQCSHHTRDWALGFFLLCSVSLFLCVHISRTQIPLTLSLRGCLVLCEKMLSQRSSLEVISCFPGKLERLYH